MFESDSVDEHLVDDRVGPTFTTPDSIPRTELFREKEGVWRTVNDTIRFIVEYLASDAWRVRVVKDGGRKIDESGELGHIDAVDAWIEMWFDDRGERVRWTHGSPSEQMG